MVQGGGGLRLPLEARQCLRVLGNFVREKLQGDEAAKGNILGLVDDTHPAASDLLHNAVVRDSLADHSGGAWSFWAASS